MILKIKQLKPCHTRFISFTSTKFFHKHIYYMASAIAIYLPWLSEFVFIGRLEETVNLCSRSINELCSGLDINY